VLDALAMPFASLYGLYYNRISFYSWLHCWQSWQIHPCTFICPVLAPAGPCADWLGRRISRWFWGRSFPGERR